MRLSLLDRFKTFTAIVFVVAVVFGVGAWVTRAGAPGIINYQGRVSVNGLDFTGSGLFKFALVNPAGTVTYWGNDGTSTTANEPTSAVTIAVNKGLYSVVLGDVSITNMTVIPSTVFNNQDVRLRIWFNDGTNGSQVLAPDQRITASGYAFVASVADTVADGGITTMKIADGAVTYAKIQNLSAPSVLLGCGSSMAGAPQEIALGANLSMSGVTLNSTSPMITKQVFTTNATWIKPAGCKYVIVEVVGGGGGGGAIASQNNGGGGGGGGGYAKRIVTSPGATETVTVGLGGTGGTSNGMRRRLIFIWSLVQCFGRGAWNFFGTTWRYGRSGQQWRH